MNGQTRRKLASWTRSLVVLGHARLPRQLSGHSGRRSSPSRASRWRRTSSAWSGRWSPWGRRCRGEIAAALARAGAARDAECLQRQLDPHVLLVVTINPEERVKVGRGPAAAVLQQGGYTPVLVKVVNEAAATKPLRITSPQSGPVDGGRGRPEHDAAGPDGT